MARRRKRSRPTPLRKGRVPSNTGPVTVTIESVGGRGDGICHGDVRIDGETRSRVIFVPFTLPGERVIAQPTADRGEGILATPVELLETSGDRVEAACPHFMACGGCALQHWATEAYRSWKTDQIHQHLRRVGVEVGEVHPIEPCEPATRRRASLTGRRTASGMVLGFHQRGGSRIESISECPVLVPALADALVPLRTNLTDILAPGDTVDVVLNQLDSGTDMLLVLPNELSLDQRQMLADHAERADLARLSVQVAGDPLPPEPVAVRRPPIIRFGGIDVEPPPGAFLQATASGEAAIAQHVLRASDGSNGRRLDLFAGIGTLSLPLAAGGQVHAVDGDAGAITALRLAADRAGLGARLTTETRDLFTRPVEGADLDGLDVVVFDPPRAGARAQAEALASSTVPTVVAVSCNPATFARDAAILTGGGYRLERLRPIDQFLWSPHIELVATFRR